MSEKPLNEYIDLEAYDVVPGEHHRALKARMKDDELELKTLADQVIEAEKEKSAAVDAAHHWHHRAEELEEAIQHFADIFPGDSHNWRWVQDWAKETLKGRKK